jgi:hypothetical protein
MSYVSVSQSERDGLHEEDDIDTTHDYPTSVSRQSPGKSPILPTFSSKPLSLDFDGDDPPAEPQNDKVPAPVANWVKSLSSSQSYQMVGDDDYDEPLPEVSAKDRLAASTDQSPEPPMRTASISRHLPLHHPMADLQSLQGGLVKNVERLEETAERLSMTSSLEDELTKMKQDQRRIERQSSGAGRSGESLRSPIQRQFSTGSWSNSIIGVNQAARAGGYSPAGYITSPTGSIRSQHVERKSSKSSQRSNALPEPLLEGRPLELNPERRPSSKKTRDTQVGSPRASIESDRCDRPPTSVTKEQEDEDAFGDFDGVHYSGSMTRSSRQLSLGQPPLARDSKVYKEAQPGERMIYYPAPVPVMLNLPPRLSNVNITQREKRRLQALSGVPEEMRKSAAWLNDQDARKMPATNANLKLPPQLRASAFFEAPGATQNLQLKNGSAVQTLDSILDAAAYAPVSAFTDHPIAGQLGKEVYGPARAQRKSMQVSEAKDKRRRSSVGNMLKARRSSTGLSILGLARSKSRGSQNLEVDENTSGDELDKATAAEIAPDEDELTDEEDEDDQAPPGFSTAPTTLLAELQMRKEQQKLRNRTAADTFPNGMHSTLLELDAVTQLQQKARKTKHVTLAWEDHEEADKQNFDDDDVPLGVLFPDKERDIASAQRPIGLLEKRELEDNEPLSHRRARLRGEPIQQPRSDMQSQAGEEERAPFIDDVPGLSQEVLAEDEDETMAQRAARMKREKERGVAGQFTDDVASQLGLDVAPDAPAPSKTPEVEETLAQRKQRLKDEAAAKGPAMHNLASVLQAHPVGVREQIRQAQPRYGANTTYTTNWGSAQQRGVPGVGGYPTNMPYGAPIPTYMQQQPYGYPNMNQPFVMDPGLGPPLDPKQRAQIDRWRQSVVQ